MQERIRVVVAGSGPGGPGPSAEVVARVLRDAGMEVVYTDRPHAPEQLAATVVQEDVDAVGLVLAPDADPAHLTRLTGLLAERGIDDVLVFAAGDPDGDGAGAARVFPRDTDPAEVVRWLQERLRG